MDSDENTGSRLANDLFSLAADQYRNGIAPSEIEAMLVERGVSSEMAAHVVANLLTRATASRGFGNLNLDLWHVIRSNPFLFVLLPAIVWFPFRLFAEHVSLATGGGWMNEVRTYNNILRIPEIFVGAWLSAVVFYGVRRLAEGSKARTIEAIWGGTKQYGRFLRTTWAYAWRVGLGLLFLLIPGLVLSVRFALAIPVTAFEGLSGKDAVDASEDHMTGKFWRLTRYLMGFILVYIPWGFAITALMPLEESPFLNAVGTIPFDIMFAMWSIWLALMYADALGNPALAAPVGCAHTYLRDGTPQRIVPRGRKRVTVTTILGVTLMILGWVYQREPPAFEGARIAFGDDERHEIFYDDDVERSEAWQLGYALMEIGWFEEEFAMAVRLGSDQKNYWLYFYIVEEVVSDEELMEFLRWTESYLTEVMGKPTRLVMLLPAWAGVKEIGVSREIRPLDSWEADSSIGEPAVVPEIPMAGALLEPIAESAAGNREIARWIDAWTEVCGELLPWSFALVDTDVQLLEEDAGREFRWLAEGEDLAVLKSTLEWSPSEELALNMFVHNLNRRGSGWLLQRLEPERWVYLFRASDTKGWPILIVGPATRLHALGWVGDHTAVVLGISWEGEEECLYIWRFNVDGLTVFTDRHKGPVVTSSQYDQLTRRWLDWVQKHYPDIEWAEVSPEQD